MVDYSPALMTDMYEYTMLDAALKDGTADRKCVFEVFTRHLPEGRRYGVVAGTGRILDALEHFHLDEADLKFLADRHVVSPETIKWLENFHFSGTIRGYREGEMFFPNSPILQVEGTFGECTLLETLILSVLNYDSAVASAASRMASAAKDRPCMDMGGRRTNEWAAVAAAMIGEFTSVDMDLIWAEDMVGASVAPVLQRYTLLSVLNTVFMVLLAAGGIGTIFYYPILRLWEKYGKRGE